MSDDTKVQVEVGASTENLDKGMQSAAQSVQSGAAGMRNGLGSVGGAINNLTGQFKNFLSSLQSSMSGAAATSNSNTSAITGHFQSLTGSVGGAVSGLQSQLGGLSKAVSFVSANFAALAAVAAGVGVFKEGINATRQFTGEALGLSKALNIGASEAAGLNVALGAIGATSDTVIEASQHLARQLRQNEDALKSMGLKTRDASGQFRNMKDLTLDAVKVMGEYKEGTDRALAGQVLFGKGAAETGSLLKLNNKVLEEAAQKQRELGLTVTQENIAASKEYKKAMNDVSDVMLALKKTIGDAVMPIFAKFGEWLASVGPGAVFILKGAIDGLAATFWYAKNGVVVLWETINALVVTVAEPIRALGAALYKALTGDWKGAKAELSGIGDVMASAWKGAMSEIEKSSEETNKRVSELFMPGHEAKATDTSKQKSFKEPEQKTKTKDTRMAGWEATLLADKTAYMEQNEMREMSLQDEKGYWVKILATLKDGDAQKTAVKKKIAELEFADEKRIAKQSHDLQLESIDLKQKLDLAAVDAEQQADAQKLALMQETQAQSIQHEMDFENKRYDIQRKALQDRLDLLSKDPTVNLVERQKILDQMLVMEQKHINDVQKIENKAALETKKPYIDLANSIQSSFKQSLAGMLNGTTTFAGAMKGLFTSILGAFADMVAEMVAKWLAAQISNRIVQAGTGVAGVMSNAAVAASAAFASTAAIPMIGPEMAPAASAAAYAATAAWAPAASARNGYDIPAGVNPVTQLHEREMVLPAKQADAVRDMADGKAGRSGGDIHIHAVDAKSIERLLKGNGRAVASALHEQARRFALKG